MKHCLTLSNGFLFLAAGALLSGSSLIHTVPMDLLSWWLVCRPRGWALVPVHHAGSLQYFSKSMSLSSAKSISARSTPSALGLLLITPAAVSAIAVLSACGDSSIGIAMAATVLSGTLSCSSWVWVYYWRCSNCHRSSWTSFLLLNTLFVHVFLPSLLLFLVGVFFVSHYCQQLFKRSIKLTLCACCAATAKKNSVMGWGFGDYELC